MPQTEDALILPLGCTGCLPHAPWDAQGICGRCSLTQAEVRAFWDVAVAHYDAAQQCAREGRWDAARAHLADARRNGLIDSCAVRQLEAICRAVTGDWHGVEVDLLPHAWQKVFDVDSPVRVEYATAIAAARDERWEDALLPARRAYEAAPWLLPAARLFALASATNAPEPIAEVTAPSPVTPPVLSSTSASMTLPPVDRRLLRWVGTSAGASVLSACVASAALWQVVVHAPVREKTYPPVRKGGIRSSDLPAAVESTDAIRPLPSVAKPDSPLPDALRREQEEKNLTLAQSWFNQAVRARREKRYVRAEQWAQAVYMLVPDSYLADESLLLRAQAADNRKSPDAHKYYADVARLTPASHYAPVALGEAIRAADALKQRRTADSYREILRTNYADSPAARRLQAQNALPSRSDRKQNDGDL